MSRTTKKLLFPLESHDLKKITAWRDNQLLPSNPFVCLHPGGRKGWDTENFTEIMRVLSDMEVPVVITGSQGSMNNQNRVPYVFNAIPLKLNVGCLAALLTQSLLVVTDDPGLTHLATALDVPSLSIFAERQDMALQSSSDTNRHLCIWQKEDLCLEKVMLALCRQLLMQMPLPQQVPA